ncbi:MAG: nodulation protein NfeD, partial [Chitinophagales bacterium]
FFTLICVTLSAQTVISIKIDGAISPVAASFIHRSIEKAQLDKAECLLIHLNTPGGLLNATRNIVGDMLESKVPVIVYVSPAGAHAGSAGVFITLAADIAVMAPGTNIGAAHPVTMGGEMDTTMSRKATNDAAAFIRTIAEYRKRNLEWAEEAVRESVAITSSEAMQKTIIDLIANNDKDLLEKIDGRIIVHDSSRISLHTRNATIQTMEMSFTEKILDLVSNPDIAYILLLLGFFGLAIELFNPGAILPGVVGFISLILAFYSLNTLPVNWAGLALIIFGLVLFFLEIKTGGHGLLAIAGVATLIFGSLMLIQPGSTLEFARISRTVIISSVTITTAFMLFVVGMGLKAQRLKPVTGIEGMLGEHGEALDNLNPTGRVQVRGEIWKAVSISGNIEEESRIRVKEIRDLTLYVEKVNA